MPTLVRVCLLFFAFNEFVCAQHAAPAGKTVVAASTTSTTGETAAVSSSAADEEAAVAVRLSPS